mgnify:CR=1 FL=1
MRPLLEQKTKSRDKKKVEGKKFLICELGEVWVCVRAKKNLHRVNGVITLTIQVQKYKSQEFSSKNLPRLMLQPGQRHKRRRRQC